METAVFKPKSKFKPKGSAQPKKREPDLALQGQKVRVHFIANGRQPLEGILGLVSRYQLVILKQDHSSSTIVYKHAIERIEAMEGG